MTILAMVVLLAAGLAWALWWNRRQARRDEAERLRRLLAPLTRAFEDFAATIGAALMPAMIAATEAIDQFGVALREAGIDLDADGPISGSGET